jgi:membrane protease YdiL (CAAX protease family)
MTPSTSLKRSDRGAGHGLRRLVAPANLMTSLVLIFPLFLFYQLGVLLSPEVVNGADLITGRLLRLLHQSAELYLLINVVLLLAFVLVVALLRRHQQFSLKMFVPVVLESALYAVTMGTLIVQVMGWIGIDPSLSIEGAAAATARALPKSTVTRVALTLGAGVHEELVFRLTLLTGTVGLFHHVLGLRRWLGIVLAFLVTSLLFSAAHHVLGGEPWRLGVFVYRFFCGLVFATLFQLRGLAVAVYTHALYDVYVMVMV